MKIILMHNNTLSQMLGIIMVTKNGSVIAVDGGTAGDTTEFKKLVAEHGGKIDLWFITHPHQDHYSVFKTFSDGGDTDIKVGKLCYSPSAEDFETHEPGGMTDEILPFRASIEKTAYNMVELKKGDCFELDNVRVDILRVVNPTMSQASINDLSIVCRITEKLSDGKEFRFMVLGDLGVVGGYELLELYKDEPDTLKADAVQLAHHGQNGVDLPVYEAIAPEYAFWSTPDWLWTNTPPGWEQGTGPWKTLEVRAWMEKLGAKPITAMKENAVFYTDK